MDTFAAFLAFVTLLGGTLAAQSPAARSGAIFLPVAKREKDAPVSIGQMNVQTRIAGLLAETTVTLTLNNPNDRPLEGEFSYPLPSDATLQGYALDVDGRMVDGVPVPKQKARIVFEEEQRKGVDPGLVEWSGGNRFQTRVSPIPAHGKRTVRLRFTSMIALAGEKASATYRLPLDFDHVEQFNLSVDVLATNKPSVSASGLGNMTFREAESRFVLEREWRNLALKEDLVIDLPQVEEPPVYVERCDGAYYFSKVYFRDPRAFVLPMFGVMDRVDIFWDASASMASVDKTPIYEFFQRVFSVPDRKCSVRLIVTRNAAETPRTFTIVDGDASELLRAMKNIRYDGATAGIDLSLADWNRVGIVVTDGKVNFYPVSPGKARRVASYAILADSGTDCGALRSMGASLIIDLLNGTPERALQRDHWYVEGLWLSDQPLITIPPGQRGITIATNAFGHWVRDPFLITGIVPE